jgi:hypothetical protein
VFDLKTDTGIGQTGGQELNKIRYFCPPLNHGTTFYPQHNFSKITKITFFLSNIIQDKICLIS